MGRRVPITAIVVDRRLQVRIHGLQEQRVRELMEAAQADGLPPLLVTPDPQRPDRHLLIDGHHRLTALNRLGVKDVEVEVREGLGWLDALRANVAHGLPLSIADRKAAAVRLKRENPQLSVREIARIVGLAPSTVQDALKTPRRYEGGSGWPPLIRTHPVRSFLRWVTRAYIDHCQDPGFAERLARELAEIVESERDPGTTWDALVAFKEAVEMGWKLTEPKYQENETADP